MTAKEAKEIILILGARGMLGTDLARQFSDLDIYLLDKEEVDVTDTAAIQAKIKEIAPTVIINATGYTDVVGAEQNRAAAFKLNGEAVRYITKAAGEIQAKLVHFSTEYVFDGKNKDGYGEAAPVNPLNIYGESKAAGEKFVIGYNQGYLVRTSWLYGHAQQRGKPRGVNFVDSVLARAASGETLRIVNDQFGKPTSTLDLAYAVRKLVSNNYPGGIYHLVNEDVTTWFELARTVLLWRGLKTRLVPLATKDYYESVRRPQYGVLINNKFPQLRPWQNALRDYLANSL